MAWSGKALSFPSVDSGTCGSSRRHWPKVVTVRADQQGQGSPARSLRASRGVGDEPALALCSAKGSRTSFLVLSASGGTTARRFQGPHRSNGGAVSAECSVRLRHRPTPFKRMCVYGSNAALREARCSGQLWLRNKPPRSGALKQPACIVSHSSAGSLGVHFDSP